MSGACSVDEIRQFSILSGLDDADLLKIAPRFSKRIAQAGEILFEVGDPAGDTYFVISGSLRSSMVSPQGREVIFTDVVPGWSFGELSALDERSRSISLHALELSTLAVLKPRDFNKLLDEYPSVARAQMQTMAYAIRMVTRRVYEQSALLTTERVKAELLRLSRAAPDGAGHIIHPLPSQAEIAARVGSHREAVNRIMTRLGQAGLINRDSGGLHIPDLAALRESSGAG